jgi:hypothetical protein
VSQSFDYDLEILKKYEHKWSNLKTVVLPVSCFSLFTKLNTAPDRWLIKNYILYFKMNTSKELRHHTEIMSRKLWINLKKLFSYYIIGNKQSSYSSLGWGMVYNSKKGRDLIETGNEAAKRHSVNDFVLSDENVSMLDSIINFCKQNNTNIILLTPPAYETYRNNMNKAQIDFTIRTAAQEASKNDNCIYLNEFADTSFKAGDFFDADHLNEIGARKLSLLINETILENNISISE